MIRLMATVRLVVLTIVIVGMTGCGGGASGHDSTDTTDTVTTSQALIDCSTYDGYTAALAEATIDCTGTIGPNSFAVDLSSGLLGRRFSACTLPGTVDSLLRIDRLLSLQLRPDLPLVNVCFAKAWTNWLVTIVTQNISVCPVWTKLSASGSPTPQNVAQNTQTLPPLPNGNPHVAVPYGKEQFLYSVRFSSPLPLLQLCRTPQSCARACTGGFEGFYVGQSGDDIIGDPYWWLDPNDYSPSSPYRSPGYYHPMSYAEDDVPGAVYGDWARRGEACSWWNGAQHVGGTLWEDKLNPYDRRTWMSRCD
jgi:hypothetical protein